MIDHITITVSDYKKAKNFYENILGICGYKIIFEYNEQYCGFGKDKSEFWIGKIDDYHQTSKNIHIAFTANSKEVVDNFHRKTIELGAKDNGGPGYREIYGPGYYASFVIDHDGNNIEAIFREPINS